MNYSWVLVINEPAMDNRPANLLNLHSYTPDGFLDHLLQRLGLKNDAALARLLAVTPAIVSRIRNRKLPVSCNMLLAIHEATNIAIRELRRMMGDTRRLFS